MTSRHLATPQSRNTFKMYWLEAKYELFKSLRLPIFAISSLTFPVLFYLFFGITFGQGSFGDVSVATYYLATYGTFGVIGTALFGFGAGVASERGQGWMRLKRASPMPPLSYFVAKLFMAAVFSTLIYLLLLIIGLTLGDVSLSLTQMLGLWGILVLGTLPFAALGLTIGYAVGPNSAPAVVNLVYLPMAFASGLWIPIEALPKFMQHLAPFLAPYHLAQLALNAIGAGSNASNGVHILVLLIYMLVFLILAIILYRRDEGKTFG
ncbi:MAG: ABC transporter permease [Trueperaceae bacterium]|nr:ABC transporter permease [Trueperaceae bacterium]